MTPRLVLASSILAALIAGCGTTPSGDEAPTLATLPPWDEGLPSLEVPLPPDYSIRTDKNGDYDVHTFESDSPSAGVASIYVGHSPSLLHRQMEPAGEVREHEETIGGEKATVYDFEVEDAEQGRLPVREVILTTVFTDDPSEKKLAELRVHISASAPTQEELDKLWTDVCQVRRKGP